MEIAVARAWNGERDELLRVRHQQAALLDCRAVAVAIVMQRGHRLDVPPAMLRVDVTRTQTAARAAALGRRLVAFVLDLIVRALEHAFLDENDTKLGVISISEIKCMNMNPTYSGDRHVFARCQLEFSADYKDQHPEKRNKRTVTAPKGSEARFEEMFHFIAHHVYFKPTGKKDGKFASKEVSVPTMRYQADKEGANQYLNTIGESTMSILISVYDDHKQMKLTSYSDHTLLGTFRIKLEDVVMHGEEFISRRFLNEELEGYNIADNTNGNTLESRKISLKFEWRLAKKSM